MKAIGGPFKTNPPEASAIGTVISVNNNKLAPTYAIRWDGGGRYGVGNTWAEEWLRKVVSDEIGQATEEWEKYYFGE